MSKQTVQPAVQEALEELQLYLSDQMAPMMVTESVELLLRCPPQYVAKAIHTWVVSQYRGAAADAPLSDCLFHAVKKIHLMSEFQLLPQEQIDQYVAQLGRLVLQMCPEADRPNLIRNLRNLGEAETATTHQVEILHRQSGSGASRPGSATSGSGGATPQTASAAPQAPGSEALARAAAAMGGGEVSEEAVERGMNRFAKLLDRLSRMGGSVAAAHEGRLQGQLLTTAAASSRSDEELEMALERLSGMGVAAKTDEIFRSLGESLPGWSIADPSSGGEVKATASRPLEAMKNLISMAGSADVGAKRFGEMVLAAVEQFNEGRLVQAAAMLELADQVVEESRLNLEVVRGIKDKSHENLSADRLREFAEIEDRQVHLRKVMGFFPAYTTKGLLGALVDEPKRERRKLMLALLEAHGPAARRAALELLEAYIAGGSLDPHGYFQRNLVFLLRRIPRETDEGLEREADLLAQLVLLGNPLIVIKETIGALALMSHPKCEKALIVALREFEEALVKDEGIHPANELRVLLERTTGALARQGGKNGARAVTAHAFRREPPLGDTMARLDALGAADLSGDAELVQRLIETLRAELPKKVLGFTVKANNDSATHLVQALSGTPSPVVRALFQEIVERFPDRGHGAAAAKALAKLGASSRPAPEDKARVMSGDVALFGLPNLLQSLADSQVTGVLSLSDAQEQPLGTLYLEGGKIRGCRAMGLEGEPAFYQLFQVPVPGAFTFRGRDLVADEQAYELEILPALLEAIRRHDEFQQAQALVPDDATFKPTGTKPTRPPEDEEDAGFMKEVWHRASKGAQPNACERELAVDSFRVRRLYAHWLEQGALTVAS